MGRILIWVGRGGKIEGNNSDSLSLGAGLRVSF
jgi:hypothetical protein